MCELEFQKPVCKLAQNVSDHEAVVVEKNKVALGHLVVRFAAGNCTHLYELFFFCEGIYTETWYGQ